MDRNTIGDGALRSDNPIIWEFFLGKLLKSEERSALPPSAKIWTEKAEDHLLHMNLHSTIFNFEH